MSGDKELGGRIVTKSPEELASRAAAHIADTLREAIEARKKVSLALSGGNTPRTTYALLAKDDNLPWEKIEIYWVDERAVSPTSGRSNYRTARESLLDPAGISSSRIHRMQGEESDLAQAARDYESVVKARVTPGDDGMPAFDVMVLGVGDDGHTASLFPDSDLLDERTRLVADVPAMRGREARLTITPPLIEAARTLFVLASGPSKMSPLTRAWEADGDLKATPIRVVRGARGRVTWIVDQAAAASLSA